MENLLAFLSKFCSYIILMLVIVVVAAIGFVVGRVIRKGLDKNKDVESASPENYGAASMPTSNKSAK